MTKIKKLHQQALLAFNQGQYQLAHKLLLSILQSDQHFSDAYFLLGMIASAFNNYQKALQLINQAHLLSQNNSEYLAQLAKHHALVNNHVLALKFAKHAAQQSNKSALTLDTIGVTYSKIGLHQLAVPYFQQAISLNNNNPSYFFNLGASLKFIGDFQGARNAYEKTIELAPTYYKAHAALTSLGGIGKNNNHISKLTEIYKTLKTEDDILYIGHALAREYEAVNDFDQAFYYLEQSKKVKRNALNYAFSQDDEMFKSLHNMFAMEYKEGSSGFDTSEPIFIVGMPRTGTTLVERIISQHTSVTSAGELQHFGLLLKKMAKTDSKFVIDPETIAAAADINFSELGQAYIESTRAITGKTAKFIDKMPLNVLYVGFILKALPNAKIICLERNPLDTIMSNFRQLFAVNFSYYNYAYDLTTTTKFYLSFKKLVDLWLKQYSDNFYVINYEALVNNPEVEAKQLLNFCELPWQDNCLNINENTTPVATASAVQVRKPINNKSIGNWRKYDAYLKRVKEILP